MFPSVSSNEQRWYFYLKKKKKQQTNKKGKKFSRRSIDWLVRSNGKHPWLCNFCVIKCTRAEEFSGCLLCWRKASARNYLSLINVKGESRSVRPERARSCRSSYLVQGTIASSKWIKRRLSQQTRCSRLAVDRNLISSCRRFVPCTLANHCNFVNALNSRRLWGLTSRGDEAKSRRNGRPRNCVPSL